MVGVNHKSLYIMKKYILLLFAAAALAACDDDENWSVSQPALDAFEVQYPTAQDVQWMRWRGYYVADFNQSVESLPTDNLAWYDGSGVWYLTQSDIPFALLPKPVSDAFAASEYSAWQVEDVESAERADIPAVYTIECEGAYNDMLLYYTADGLFIKAVDSSIDPIVVPLRLDGSIKNFLNRYYSGATILNVALYGYNTVVDILDEDVVRELLFNGRGYWVMTQSRIAPDELPAAVVQAIASSQYASWQVEAASLIDTNSGSYYQVKLDGGKNEVVLRISLSGQII